MAVSKTDCTVEARKQAFVESCTDLLEVVCDDILLNHSNDGDPVSVDLEDIAEYICTPNGVNPFELLNGLAVRYPNDWNIQFSPIAFALIFS